MGGGEKSFDMGEIFVIRLPLVPLPTISRENAGVKHKLVGVVHNLLGQVGCGAGVGICNGAIDLMPDDLDGVGRGVCLAEELVVHNPVSVGDDDVGLVEVGKQIQSDGSAIPLVRPVFYPNEVVLDGAHKLLTKVVVYIPKGVESKRGRVVSIADGRYFGSDSACREDRRCSGIGRGHGPCFREGCIDGGGEGEAKVSECAASKVCVDGRRFRVEELVYDVDCGVHRFVIDQWDCGVLKALDELIDGGSRHGGGKELINDYNYMLQWLYGRDVSYIINERFCAYCAHSTVIYRSPKIRNLE